MRLFIASNYVPVGLSLAPYRIINLVCALVACFEGAHALMGCKAWSLMFALCMLALGLLLGAKASQLASKEPSVRAALPIVLWHGMGDSCCASYSLGAVKKHIEQALDGAGPPTSLHYCRHQSATRSLLPLQQPELAYAGAFVLSINTGSYSSAADTLSGFYGNVNSQVGHLWQPGWRGLHTVSCRAGCQIRSGRRLQAFCFCRLGRRASLLRIRLSYSKATTP